jgi:hypothetical protein
MLVRELVVVSALAGRLVYKTGKDHCVARSRCGKSLFGCVTWSVLDGVREMIWHPLLLVKGVSGGDESGKEEIEGERRGSQKIMRRGQNEMKRKKEGTY